MAGQGRNDGGSAFPRTVYYDDGEWEHISGMSLRDWFAGIALQGIIAAHAAPAAELPDEEDAAVLAYGYADAMLAERERRVAEEV